jgi:hypothetical protein
MHQGVEPSASDSEKALRNTKTAPMRRPGVSANGMVLPVTGGIISEKTRADNLGIEDVDAARRVTAAWNDLVAHALKVTL